MIYLAIEKMLEQKALVLPRRKTNFSIYHTGHAHPSILGYMYKYKCMHVAYIPSNSI
jgi:hypothetical protein